MRWRGGVGAEYEVWVGGRGWSGAGARARGAESVTRGCGCGCGCVHGEWRGVSKHKEIYLSIKVLVLQERR